MKPSTRLIRGRVEEFIRYAGERQVGDFRIRIKGLI
jgi:hypothetical protein